KLKLEIKDMEGPEELVHNKSGTYIVKFNRKASDNERNKVSWVVRINGKETDRFENAGETLEFTPIGKYAGETVTVHPFLRSPSDSLCVETTVGECLVFDGSKLIWLDEKHNEKGTWKAVTGKGDNSDPKKKDGPIPEGRWVVLQTKREVAEKDNWWENLINRKTSSDSANERIGLIPFSTTDTHKRDEVFYIHGSKEADTLPGVNLGEGIDDFVDFFVNSGKNLVLVVRFAKIEKVHDGVLLKKGDKGEIVEEINIRLSGFGGGPPSDIFDDLTERKIKNFQRDYMKMKEPTGVLDKATVVAIDEFRKQKIITYEIFERLKCKCGNCSGFGKQRYKNVYNSTEKSEKYNKYEYPGIHRSLLWAVSALFLKLNKNSETGARFFDFSSGYRCHDHNITKNGGTTNHMGKAVDITFYSFFDDSWTRPTDKDARNKTVEAVRKACTKDNWLNAQYGWREPNKFSMETTEQGAVTWVHIDVREFEPVYLANRFMCSTHSQYLGESLESLFKRILL
ncbi:MAG TPA: peptidoglycan-binding domain-containing protein, partial [Chitinispirillaceae bacterium]|nr:peptidoglycan-binding domain-containing protein [Chitinispirillaceae bacterium]